MFEINDLKTDPKKEAEGVWIDIDGKGAKLLIARNGNPVAKAKWEKLTSDPAVRNAFRRETIDEQRLEDMLVEVLADAVLLGWEGITEGGKPVKYSPAKARELLKVKLFRNLVQDLANDYTFFRQTVIADSVDALKKS